MGLHREVVINDHSGFRRELCRNWGERDYKSDRRKGVSHALSHEFRRKRKNDANKIITEELYEKD